MSTLTLPRPSWRAASVVAALLLVASTCGTTADVAGGDAMTPLAADGGAVTSEPLRLDDYPGHAVRDDGTRQGRPDASIPDVPSEGDEGDDPSGVTTRTVVEPSPIAEKVELHEPDLVLRSGEQVLFPDDADVDGTAYAAPVREFTAITDTADGEEHELELLAADAVSLRPLTPDVTAQSQAVWQRLDDGDALVRHDIAHELGLELGERMALRTEQGTTTVRIGALAANGAPPLADIVVPFEVASDLGHPAINALVVSVDDDTEPKTVADRLDEVGEVELRRPPEPERATPRPTGGSVELEPFTYTSRGDGTIAIHGDWVQRNIVTVDLPRMGRTRCHRAMVPQLFAALQELIDEGLYDHFKPEQFGGCWVPRHIMWNPSRGLSMHAWGLAIDFNVQDNWYGKTPKMDRRVVEVFEKWGFEWGGHWSTPDGMHFELRRFVQAD